jgi:NADH-quinone oxidoreductase subunit N
MFPNSALIDRLQSELGQDLLAFLPETILCGAIVLMLVLRLFGSFNRAHLGWLALAASVVAFAVAAAQWFGVPWLTPQLSRNPVTLQLEREVFTGLLVYDSFSLFVRVLLFGFLTLTLWLTLLTGIPDRDDSADFATLLLGGTLGMVLMASAQHLLMVFIAVEMASVPSYVLAGFLKGRRKGSEAALKYVVYGASASGVMLYGISLLTAKFGTGHLPVIGYGFYTHSSSNQFDPIMAVGVLLILVGLFFKLAAVPFHFWCPDVFEGAAAEVAAFLSVASKGAAVALTARFLIAITGPSSSYTGVLMTGTLGLGLAFFAAATATVGNLAALGQTNLKRLLAYSTIAHAGYMLMALATLSLAGVSAALFYLIAYLFMNLGAFAIVALLRNRTGSEDLNDFRGMIQRSPLLVVALAIFLLSLLGLPPLAGFVAKFQVFAALFLAGGEYATHFPYLSYVFYGLLAVAGINTVISAAYYLRVLRVMVLDAPPAGEQAMAPLKPSRGAAVYALVLTGAVVAVGIFWDPLTAASERAANTFKVDMTPPAFRNKNQ